jgi:N-glycosylase/DNA lyase
MGRTPKGQIMITYKLTHPGDDSYIKQEKRFRGLDKDTTFAVWNGKIELGRIANHYYKQRIRTTFKINSETLEVETDKETYYDQNAKLCSFPAVIESREYIKSVDAHWKDDDQELYNTTLKD